MTKAEKEEKIEELLGKADELNNKGGDENNEKAIVYYDEALSLDDKNTRALNNKGIALSDLGKYADAMECYDNIPSIDENHIKALSNKGVALERQGDTLDAIEYYCKALAIEPYYERALNNLEISSFNAKQYTELPQYFSKANLTTLSALIRLQKNKREPAGVKTTIELMLDNENEYFSKVLKRAGITHESDPVCYKAYKNIYIKTLEIVLLLHVRHDSEQNVAHYTDRQAPVHMLLGSDIDKVKSKFRLSTIAAANDPKEGHTLFEYLGVDDKYVDTCNNYQAFIGCFTFNHQSLNQFRLYGKVKNEEATGVSIVVNKDFFSDTANLGNNVYQMESKLETRGDKKEEDPSEKKKEPLFRCIYIDPQTEKVISVGHKEEYAFYRENIDMEDGVVTDLIKDYQDEINKCLEGVKKHLDGLRKTIQKQKLDKKIIRELLLMLRYLVKHVAFKEEQECRVLRIEPLHNNKKVKIKGDKMFVEYTTIENEQVHKLYMAPQFEKFALYRDTIKKECNIDSHLCDHPFALPKC